MAPAAKTPAAGLGKLAAGGAIGLVAGALVTVLSAFALVFKLIRKVILSLSRA